MQTVPYAADLRTVLRNAVRSTVPDSPITVYNTDDAVTTSIALMTAAPTILEARCDVWTCGGSIPDVPLEEVEYILNHPGMNGYTGQPERIVSMARFMVTIANEFLMCYLTALGCLDLAVHIDPNAADAVTHCLAYVSPCQWGPAKFVIDGCIQNLPQDRIRLRAAVTRGLVPRTELAEFDTWHARAKAAKATFDWVLKRLERCGRRVTPGVGFDGEALDRLTEGRIVATMLNLDLDQKRCLERMEEAWSKNIEREEARQHQCVLM